MSSLFLADKKLTPTWYFFRLALKQLSEIEGWSSEQLKAIIARAKTVWVQAVNEWDKDQVSELGKILSKLYCYYIAVTCVHESSRCGVFSEITNIAMSSLFWPLF